MGQTYKDLPAETRQYHERCGEAASESARLSGQGFALSKTAQTRETAKQLQQQRRNANTQHCELNPEQTAAAVALKDLDISEDTPFDDGISRIKRGILDATASETVALALQGRSIDEYDRSVRNSDGLIADLPTEVSGLLDDQWRLRRHLFAPSLKHMRGPFQVGTRAAFSVAKMKGTTTLNSALGDCLVQYRKILHAPVLHEETETPTKEEQSILVMPCNLTGFCVHGSDGLDIRAMRSQLLRRIFGTRFKSKQDAKLLDGLSVCICIYGHPKRHGGAVVGVAGAALPDEHVDDAVIIWAHLGDFLRAPQCFHAHILKQESPSKPLALLTSLHKFP